MAGYYGNLRSLQELPFHTAWERVRERERERERGVERRTRREEKGGEISRGGEVWK